MPTLDESLLHLLGSSGQALTAEEAHQKVRNGFHGPTLANVAAALLRLRNKGLVQITNNESRSTMLRDIFRVMHGDAPVFPTRYAIAN